MKHAKFKYHTFNKIRYFMSDPYRNKNFYALLLTYHYFAFEEYKGLQRWLSNGEE